MQTLKNKNYETHNAADLAGFCVRGFASMIPIDVTWKNDASTETLVFLVRTIHIGTLSFGTRLSEFAGLTPMKKTTCQKTLYHVALDTAYKAGYHDYFDVTQKVC